MYYIGFFLNDINKMMMFREDQTPTRNKYPYFGKVIGPYGDTSEARMVMKTLRRGYGYSYEENPAVSERQRRFMCAELGRKRAGRETVTGMRESQLRDFCVKHNPVHSEGYYVMKWGGGRYTSVAWYKTKAEAEREVKRIYQAGAWSGMPPKIETAVRVDGLRGVKRKKNPTCGCNPEKVISHRQALALTKKVIAYGKKLFRHEQKGVKGNPGEGYHNRKFLEYLRELEKYKIGSQPYIATLAKAYEHLESAKASMHEK